MIGNDNMDTSDTNDVGNTTVLNQEGSSGKRDDIIETFDDWSVEEHIQFLQAFKRYGTDWGKVLQCISSPTARISLCLEQVKTHGIAYLKRGQLGIAYYEYIKSNCHDDDENSMQDEDEGEEDDDRSYLSTPEALASAFLTNRESVKEWNLETRRLESNAEKLKNNQPLDCSPASTNELYSDKLSLLQSNYGELLERLDIENQTHLLDEEVKLMKIDNRMKHLTPFERVVVRESREHIEQLIGRAIPDKPDQTSTQTTTIGGDGVSTGTGLSEETPLPIQNSSVTSIPGATQPTSSLPSTTTATVTTADTNQSSPIINPELLANQPNFRNIYTFMGALFEPNRYNIEELGAMLSPQEKEILQILLHNLSISLSTQQFQEEYSTYVHQISSSQLLRQQQQQQAASGAVTTSATNSVTMMTTNQSGGGSGSSGGIVNPFTGQPQQISMSQLLSFDNPNTTSVDLTHDQ